ncbi:MAG: LysR family transcriptional regulator [Novosphingobium sp.]
MDLNLLSAFDVLMQERSVSAAARKLNLSQPAMSAALARLREFFGDEILVVQGKRMFPTAFAEGLVPQVRHVLGGVESMLANRSQFDPATARRTFRLIASDYVIAALIAPLIEKLSVQSPGIMLDLAAPSEQGQVEIAEGRADLLISPDYYISGEHPSELLFEETHVVVGWDGNPLMQAPLSLDGFLQAGHVGVRIGAQRMPAFADRQMTVMSLSRRIEMETHSFLTIPLLLAGTRRLALMQERLARRMCRSYPLAMRDLPFEFPLMREMMQNHASRRADEGLAWLKKLLKEQAMINP